MPPPSSPVFAWWIFCVAIAGWYTGIMAVIWFRTHDVVAMLYLMISLSLLVVFGVNVIVRSGVTPPNAVTLIAIQRGMYAPLMLALGVLIDIYVAEHNGHVSLMQRLTRRFEEGEP